MPYTNEIECSHSTTVPYEDEMVVAGKGWRIGQYFTGVGATSGYCSVVFKTPAGQKTLYKAASIGKTGGEAKIELIESPTIGAGGTILTPYQLNRNRLDIVCGLTDVRAGANTAMTVINGTATPADILPGENQGSQRTPATATSAFVYLAPNTYYALKVTNLGSTTSNINILMTLAVNV